MVQFNKKSAEEELRKSMVDMFRKLDEVPISRQQNLKKMIQYYRLL